MNIKTFKGFEDIYPEKVEGTDVWYYGQWTPCSEASEVLYFDNKYPGTKLYMEEIVEIHNREFAEYNARLK